MLGALRLGYRGGVCRQFTRRNGAGLSPDNVMRVLSTSTRPPQPQPARTTPRPPPGKPPGGTGSASDGSASTSVDSSSEPSPPPRRSVLGPLLLMGLGATAVIHAVRTSADVREHLGGEEAFFVKTIVGAFGVVEPSSSSSGAEEKTRSTSTESSGSTKSDRISHSSAASNREPSSESPKNDRSVPTGAADTTLEQSGSIAVVSQKKSTSSAPELSSPAGEPVGPVCWRTDEARFDALRREALSLGLISDEEHLDALQSEAVALGLLPDPNGKSPHALKDGPIVEQTQLDEEEVGLTALFRATEELGLDAKIVEQLEKAHEEGLAAQRALLQREFDADADRFMEEARASARKWQQKIKEKFNAQLDAVEHEKGEMQREKELLERWRADAEAEVAALQASWGEERLKRRVKLQEMRNKILAMEDVFRWNSTNAFLASKVSMVVERLLVLEDALKQSTEGSDADGDASDLHAAFSSLWAVASDDVFMRTVLDSVPTSAFQSLPSMGLLKARFNRVERRAREAILSEDKGMRRHLLASLFSKLLIQEHVYDEDDTSDAKLSRAGFYLDSGDLQSCINELSALPGLEGHVCSDWVADAKRLLAVRQAVDLVRAQVTVESLRLA